MKAEPVAGRQDSEYPLHETRKPTKPTSWKTRALLATGIGVPLGIFASADPAAAFDFLTSDTPPNATVSSGFVDHNSVAEPYDTPFNSPIEWPPVTHFESTPIAITDEHFEITATDPDDFVSLASQNVAPAWSIETHTPGDRTNGGDELLIASDVTADETSMDFSWGNGNLRTEDSQPAAIAEPLSSSDSTDGETAAATDASKPVGSYDAAPLSALGIIEESPITTEQAEPEQAEPEQAEPEQAEPEQAEPEQAEPELETLYAASPFVPMVVNGVRSWLTPQVTGAAAVAAGAKVAADGNVDLEVSELPDLSALSLEGIVYSTQIMMQVLGNPASQGRSMFGTASETPAVPPSKEMLGAPAPGTPVLPAVGPIARPSSDSNPDMTHDAPPGFQPAPTLEPAASPATQAPPHIMYSEENGDRENENGEPLDDTTTTEVDASEPLDLATATELHQAALQLKKELWEELRNIPLDRGDWDIEQMLFTANARYVKARTAEEEAFSRWEEASSLEDKANVSDPIESQSTTAAESDPAEPESTFPPEIGRAMLAHVFTPVADDDLPSAEVVSADFGGSDPEKAGAPSADAASEPPPVANLANHRELIQSRAEKDAAQDTLSERSRVLETLLGVLSADPDKTELNPDEKSTFEDSVNRLAEALAARTVASIKTAALERGPVSSGELAQLEQDVKDATSQERAAYKAEDLAEEAYEQDGSVTNFRRYMQTYSKTARASRDRWIAEENLKHAIRPESSNKD